MRTTSFVVALTKSVFQVARNSSEVDWSVTFVSRCFVAFFFQFRCRLWFSSIGRSEKVVDEGKRWSSGSRSSIGGVGKSFPATADGKRFWYVK
ncbi:unnamed protein product [Linum trigynum]|uniref:Secreted protein n=1 Tax=Linum trigynum TaxID=586398 RepID=A0AAV2FN46_9ROSI